MIHHIHLLRKICPQLECHFQMMILWTEVGVILIMKILFLSVFHNAGEFHLIPQTTRQHTTVGMIDTDQKEIINRTELGISNTINDIQVVTGGITAGYIRSQTIHRTGLMIGGTVSFTPTGTMRWMQSTREQCREKIRGEVQDS